jgi:hypothetical protein
LGDPDPGWAKGELLFAAIDARLLYAALSHQDTPNAVE